ncbi:MAG TPA: hypothetical protein VF092_14675 [Longimicrobium sp.]
MAGKRPDQYQIAPGEAGASDYKNLPEVGKGKSGEDDTVTRDKQRVAGSVGGGGGPGQHFFDPDHPQPSHDSGVHAREGHGEHGGGMQASESPREREEQGSEDPRDRGVGA